VDELPVPNPVVTAVPVPVDAAAEVAVVLVAVSLGIVEVVPYALLAAQFWVTSCWMPKRPGSSGQLL
jgi:hypothetical protein